jgi:ketosteroid isomerase-like protein
MVSANLDLVRSIYAAWERGDFSSVDWAHPEIEYVAAEGPDLNRRTGVAGMTESFGNWLAAWDGFRVEAAEYRELDGGRVLVLLDLHGRGKASGLELGQMRAGANLLHLRDGKVTRFVLYADRDRVLADLGLASEAGSPDS